MKWVQHTIMLAKITVLCSYAASYYTYYAQNYAGIICQGLSASS